MAEFDSSAELHKGEHVQRRGAGSQRLVPRPFPCILELSEAKMCRDRPKSVAIGTRLCPDRGTKSYDRSFVELFSEPSKSSKISAPGTCLLDLWKHGKIWDFWTG